MGVDLLGGIYTKRGSLALPATNNVDSEFHFSATQKNCRVSSSLR